MASCERAAEVVGAEVDSKVVAKADGRLQAVRLVLLRPPAGCPGGRRGLARRARSDETASAPFSLQDGDGDGDNDGGGAWASELEDGDGDGDGDCDGNEVWE